MSPPVAGAQSCPQSARRLWPERGQALDLPADDGRARYTYSTIALLKAELFAKPWLDVEPGNPEGLREPLAPLPPRCAGGRVETSLYTGRWVDVGTPERLAQLNQ
jgi:MurNAc alpha-1-phosphate uridylyltransferase